MVTFVTRLLLMKAKGQVRLRMKPVKGGGKSLYLDIYRNGVRRYEFLHLYLSAEKTEDDRLRNEEVIRVAEAICAKRTIELQLQANAMQMPSARQVRKIMDDYLEIVKSRSAGTQEVWRCWVNQVGKWDGCSVPVSEVTRDWWNRYTLWVQRSGKHPTTQHHYLSRMRTVLRYAEGKGLLLTNPAKAVRLPHLEKGNRVYLTAEELRKLKDTPCIDAEVARAFLFGCLTGLRLSDIENLDWSAVRDSRIHLKVKKTGRLQFVELNSQAVELLGDRGTGKVFRLKSRGDLRYVLKKWGEAAGVEKKITFHTSRHTFAVLMLSSGVDIYTLSKLLGHSSVTTTQIYADILDSRRREAVDMLPRI